MKYLAIRNTPGYLPDSEPEEYDDIQSAWAVLLHDREVFEEEAEGYNERPTYSDAVLVLAHLAGREQIGGSNPQFAIPPHKGHDGQLIHYEIMADGSGTLHLATSLTHHDDDDHDLGEIYEVREAEEN